MPNMESETFEEGQSVEVGATWHRPNKSIPLHIAIECVAVDPERYEGVLYVGGKPAYRSERKADLDTAEGAVEAWFANRLVALLAPDGVRASGPGFYGPFGKWNANSTEW